MRFGALPTLQAVVRRGSLAAAALELALTPSAVSQQMRQLEDHFGRPLFDRSGRTVKPTAFALEVLATVDGALSALNALRDRSHHDVSGRVRFGVINSAQVSILPALVRTASQRYPGMQLTLEAENTSDKLVDALKSGRVDAAVVVQPRTGLPRSVRFDLLAEEPFVLIHPPDHAGSAGVSNIVRSLPWVRYNLGLEGGRMASDFVRRIARGLQPRYEVMTTDSVVAMVSEGLGFSVVPTPREPILRAYPAHIVPLGRQMPKRRIALARRRSDVDSRRIDALLTCLREVYAAQAALAEKRA